MTTYYATPGLFGGTNYYDETGTRVGSTWDSVIPGSSNHYDASGEYVGSSYTGIASRNCHQFENGWGGYSYEGMFGQTQIRDEEGSIVGSMWEDGGRGLIDLDF